MVETMTKRLSLLATLLFLPGIFILSWWAWRGLEDDLQNERHRIRHFEELAAFHVVNNLGFELFHLDFTFRLGISKDSREGTDDWPRKVDSILQSYRRQAHYPDLLRDMVLVSEPSDGPRRWLGWSSEGWTPVAPPDWVPPVPALFDQPIDPQVDLETPVMVFPLPDEPNRRQVLVVRYDVDKILTSIVPGLAQKAFEEKGAVLTYDVSVFRQLVASHVRDSEADLTVPLVPKVRFSDWLRNYLDRSPESQVNAEALTSAPEPPPGAESRWTLRVRLLPQGLMAHVAQRQARNVLWAVGLFVVLAAGFALFLLSVLRLLHASRREKAFSTLVSHELKTPVAAIRSLSENLAEGVVADGAKVREYGALIFEQSQRLGAMVGNILALSNLEAPGAALVREEFDIAELAREVASPFSLAVGAGPGPWIARGNRAAVRAALDNLVTNALRYGAKDGQAPLVALGLHKRFHRQLSWVGVSVTDHGPGVPRSEIKALFEPYRRGRQAGRRQLPGGGVGLSLVRATMKHLGGRVEVKTVPGGGLSFLLWLREGS